MSGSRQGQPPSLRIDRSSYALTPRHAGNFEQPQNCRPTLTPRFAVRRNMMDWQIGQAGAGIDGAGRTFEASGFNGAGCSGRSTTPGSQLRRASPSINVTWRPAAKFFASVVNCPEVTTRQSRSDVKQIIDQRTLPSSRQLQTPFERGPITTRQLTPPSRTPHPSAHYRYGRGSVPP